MRTRPSRVVGCLAWAAFSFLNFSTSAEIDSLPEVYIWATVAETLEPAPDTRVRPGEFTITRIGNTNEALLLFVEFSGTATFGHDYQEVTQYLVMPAGASKLTLRVAPLDDSAVEGDETVIATLSTNPPINSLPNYTVHSRLGSATVVIHDNDFPDDLPVVSIGGVEKVLESCPPNADCASISFVLRRTGPGLDRPLTVFVRYRGSAMADVDYPALPGLVTFEAGRDLALVSAIPIDDTLFEGDETIIAEVIPLLDYYVDPNHWQATTILLDNEAPAPPIVSLELVIREAMETRIDQNAIFWAEFRVLRTGPVTNELVVFLNTQQGSARLGEDYSLEGVRDGSAVRFPAGTNAVHVRLYPIDDDLYEGDESVFFHLISPPPDTPLNVQYLVDVAHSAVSMVIRDNDPVATRLEITTPRNGEHFEAGEIIPLRAQVIGPGSSNAWTIEFLDGDRRIGTTQPNRPIWWQDAIGGEHVINARAQGSEGEILEARSVAISVGPGPALPVVSIGVLGSGQTLEPCPVCFVPAAAFTISRTGPTNSALTVYLEYDGPAAPGVDYRELPQSITIPPGTNATHLLVVALDDRLVEGPEIVRARIALPEFATLGYIPSFYAREAMIVINDDEPGAPEFRIDIVEPKEGAQFAAGIAIQLSALGVWTRGEILRPVEFFAGERFIGQSSPGAPTAARPTIPGLPSVHTIIWTNPPTGRHTLTARTELSLNLWATSPPVHITVGSEPVPTVARIEAVHSIAEEDSLPFDRVPFVGVFRISHTGPTNSSVSVFVRYSGSATPGADYPFLPWIVTIPAGSASTEIRVVPIPDGVAEGLETVVATISACPPLTDPALGMPCFGPPVDPAYESATVFIRDDGLTRASLVITRPKDGAHFDLGQSIPIDVTAIDLDGYISRVEFFDGNQRIGESEIVFIREPDPGTPIFHSFEWHGASLGAHVLTARARTSSGTPISSPRVDVTVGPTSNQPPRVTILQPTNGAEFPLYTPIEIVAGARDPDGYVRRAEFFADGRKIGESRIEFILPPAPGQTQTFTFVWRFPAPRPHILTVRATDDDGAAGASGPVEIRVTLPNLLPVVTVTAPDAFAVEPSSNTVLNTASFRIRRFGPTNDQLVVSYSLHGTARNDVDYEMLSGAAVMAPGQRTARVTVRPLPDTLAEGVETVILRLEEPEPIGSTPEVRLPGYRVGFPARAVALISDQTWVHRWTDTRCVPLADGFRHVCFGAQTGHHFRVEASSDLRNWETLCTTFAADEAVHHIDDEAQNFPSRFYRLSLEPVIEPED